MKGQNGYAVVRRVTHQGVDLGTLWQGIWRRLKRWQQLAKQRRQLARLDDAALKDIGLNRADVFQEVERPFWEDPLAKAAGRHRTEY